MVEKKKARIQGALIKLTHYLKFGDVDRELAFAVAFLIGGLLVERVHQLPGVELPVPNHKGLHRGGPDLIALTVTAGTVIYGAFGGYGSFYEMFCGSVRNVLITWAISAAIALLFSAIAGIIILIGRLCLNAWKHPRTTITLAILGLLMFWQWYAEVSRSKQAMASDPWARFADAHAPAYTPPPGFEAVDDKDYPPPPRQTTTRGLLGASQGEAWVHPWGRSTCNSMERQGRDARQIMEPTAQRQAGKVSVLYIGAAGHR